MGIANITVECVIISILTFCGIFWVFYIYKQARKMYRMYLQAIKLSLTDRDTEIQYYIGKYKTQYIKNILLFISLVLESYSAVGYLIHKVLPASDIILEYTDNTQIKLNICSGANLTEYQELSNISWFNYTRILLESSHLCLVLTSAIGVALMKLIIAELKFDNPWERTKRAVVRIITVSICLSSIVLILTVTPYTWIIARIMSIPLVVIYSILFLREIGRLQAALAQYSRERLVQFGNNRREENQLFKFKILSKVLCIGVTFLVVCVTYEKINIILSLVLYYGQCYASLTFHIQYTPVLHSVPQQLILFKVLFYLSRVKLVIGILTGVIIGVPYVLITIACMVYLVYRNYIRKFKTRFSMEDLNKGLIESN